MFRYITQDGFTDTATWLIIFREDFDTIQSALSTPPDEGPNAQRHFYAILTARHEAVHFWHAISTNFLYSYSVNYLQRCLNVLNSIRNEGRSYNDIPFSEFKSSFKELTDILLSPSETIRTIDIIEGCAVHSSYRMHVPHASHETFILHLTEHHSGQKQYQHAYLYATRLIGSNAFNLFSPACYLALQGDNPGKNFVTILHRALENFHLMNAEKDPLSFLLKATNMHREEFFPSVIKQRGIPKDFSHPILQPYVEEIARSTKMPMDDIFAKPYDYEPFNSPGHTKEVGKFILRIVPPLHIYSGRMAKLMGIGSEMGKNYAILIHHLTALIGMIQTIVFGEKEQMLCPHVNCPVHKRSLCHKYYAFPLDDYKNCKFPEILEGTKLGNLLR